MSSSRKPDRKHDDYYFFYLEKASEKLESLLVETQEKLSVYVAKDDGKQIKTQVVISGSEKKTLEEMQLELEDQRELAANRMAELENMENNYKDCLKEVEKLKMDLSTLPEYVVVETTEHKCLQSQFSVLYNEAMQLKTQVGIVLTVRKIFQFLYK